MYSSTPAWRATGSSSYSQSPAFVPVTARRAFHPLTSASAVPIYPTTIQQTPHTTDAHSQAQIKTKTVWSPDVRKYVQRCFEADNLIDGISKEEMETKLKSVITQAAESNNLNSVNWEKLPLPQQMIQEERKFAILARSSVVTTPSIPAVFPHPLPLPSRSDVSKKRKSSELIERDQDQSERTPWRQASASNSLGDRVTFTSPAAEKRQRLDFSPKTNSKSQASLEQRKKRFEMFKPGPRSPHNDHNSDATTPPPSEIPGPIVGRSQILEKNYFRLTAPPNPDNVRPLAILEQTLPLLKDKWNQDRNYAYICDQFKSLRQDLTVQHLKNEFTVNVYETHARICLEKGDLGEYNQCQTQLRTLYKQNLGGQPMEFKAYRILYFIHTCSRTDMNDVLSELTPADKADGAVQHALNVRSALALGNFHRFFQLFLEAPNKGAYLMDKFLTRERLACLASMCKAYKPDVTIRHVTEELGFDRDEAAVEFIIEHSSRDLLQERDANVKFLTGKAGLTFENAKREAFKLIDLKGQI